jgi:hypothetical protein
MASFLDRAPAQFNPYIQQIDPQAYTQVGIFKQQQYDQGVARVQGMIDSVAGLQVGRDVDKQYLNNRVGELTSKLNNLVGANYDSQALISQVGGLASQIASDPNVQNAVAGTASVSKIRADIEAARKEGKLWSPQNEWAAMKGVQDWYNDPNPGAEFRGSPYNPYIDVNENINKRWKDAHPDSILRQSTNGDYYAYTMTESGYKMLPPDKVRAEIEATLDPSEVNQLNINAEYNYRNFTPDNLKSEVNTVYGEREEIYNNYIKKLEFDKLDNANNPQALKEIDVALATQNDKLASLRRNKQDTLSAIDVNPSGVKSYLYRNKWLDGMAGMIGYTEESQKIVDNPVRKQAWDEYMDWNKFQLDNQKFLLDQQKFAFEATTGGKKSKASKEGDADNLGDIGLTAPSKDPTALTIEQFNQKAINMHDQSNNDLLELIWRKNPDLFKEPQYISNSDGTLKVKYVPKDKNTLIQITAKAKQWGTMYGEGSDQLDPMVKTWFDTHYNQMQVADQMKNISQKLEKDADNYIRNQSEYSKDIQALEQYEKQLKNIRPVTIQDGTGSPVTITGTDIKNYTNLTRSGKIVVGQSGVTSVSDDVLAEYNLDRSKYNALIGNNGGRRTEIANIIEPLTRLQNRAKGAIDEKQRYINQQLRPYQFLQSNTEIQIPTNEPKLARQWAGVIERIRNQRTQEGSTLGGSTDWETVNKMMTDKNISNLQIFYVQPTAGGNPSLLLSNPDVNSGKQQVVELDIPTATDLRLYQNDPTSFARNMLSLNQGRTTGKLKFGQIGKYNVQYEVNPYLNSYIPTLYVSIPGQVTAQPVPISEGTFSSLDAITNFLRNPQLESYLDQKLGIKSPNPSLPNNPFIQSNPFLQQAQSAGIGQNQ